MPNLSIPPPPTLPTLTSEPLPIQVYMAALLGLIPLPTKIQDDVVPYVCGQPPSSREDTTPPLPNRGSRVY